MTTCVKRRGITDTEQVFMSKYDDRVREGVKKFFNALQVILLNIPVPG